MTTPDPSAARPFTAEDARRIWGDDALYCDFHRGWHHRAYHEHNGYETQALTGKEGEWVGFPPPAGNPPYCDLDGTDLIFVHKCDWYAFGGARLRKTVLSQDRWTVHQTADGQLSVSPSIYCRACELHGYFAAGEWRSV